MSWNSILINLIMIIHLLVISFLCKTVSHSVACLDNNYFAMYLNIFHFWFLLIQPPKLSLSPSLSICTLFPTLKKVSLPTIIHSIMPKIIEIIIEVGKCVEIITNDWPSLPVADINTYNHVSKETLIFEKLHSTRRVVSNILSVIHITDSHWFFIWTKCNLTT